VLVVAPRGSFLHPVHDRPDLVDPVGRPVARVPDQPEPAAGPDHPGELGEGGVGVEPVERLRDGDRFERRGDEWERLRAAGDDVDAGHGPGEHAAHAFHRLDRHEPGTGRYEQPGELARPRSEVDGGGAGADAQVLDEPGDRVTRVRRPGPLVVLGLAPEPTLGNLVHGHTRHLPTAGLRCVR
jgi:hypothetical protein